MTVDQHTDIQQFEQLWYTWSEIGLGSMGFRIRAVSEGLSDFRNRRMQILDQFQRYQLPLGTELLAVKPENAPVCLALLKPDGLAGRALVHKVYTGKDGFGRSGVFFVHLVDGLPETFSARQAIELWGSSFWQKSDESLQEDPFSTELKRVSLTDLLQGKRFFELQRPEDVQPLKPGLERGLAFLLQVFLEKEPYAGMVVQSQSHQGYFQKMPGLRSRGGARSEQSVQRTPIYLAAVDKEVALLIYGLTHCLPKVLVRDLTFSTYERDVRDASTEIAATCWLNDTPGESAPEFFPVEYYQRALTYNSYNGKSSSLEQHPLLSPRPQTEDYVQAALKYFRIHLVGEQLSVQSSLDRRQANWLLVFDELLNVADGAAQLNVDTFLEWAWKSLQEKMAQPHQVVRALLKNLLESPSPEYVAEKLSRSAYQWALATWAIDDTNWWRGARARVLLWKQQQTLRPLLMKTALRGIQLFGAFARNRVTNRKSSRRIVHTGEDRQISKAVDLLFCLANTQETWLTLLDALAEIEGIYFFFQAHWQVYQDLIILWTAILSPSEENIKTLSVILFLFQHNWRTYHDLMKHWTTILLPNNANVRRLKPLFPSLLNSLHMFLTLDLSALWQGMVLKNFLDHKEELEEPFTFTRLLEQHYHEDLAALLIRLAHDEQGWPVAEEIFTWLVTHDYKRKMQLLFVLLNAASTTDTLTMREAKRLTRLLKIAQLTFEECTRFLAHYGDKYHSKYPNLDILKQMLHDARGNAESHSS